ncbi:hypothetical protein BC830DRAFT_1132580 [Chytriomyces sp. MP71]|nr:hypothetical protein BC830DRAFT_1132580 [Chytriomyces sp. MP71]
MRPPQDTANKIILMNTAFLDITGVRPIWTPGVDALHCVLYISARVIKNMTVSATISVSGTQSEAKPICNPTMIAVVACPSYTEIVGDCHTYKCDFALPLSFPSDIYKMDAVYQICPSPSGCATMGTMKHPVNYSLHLHYSTNPTAHRLLAVNRHKCKVRPTR